MKLLRSRIIELYKNLDSFTFYKSTQLAYKILKNKSELEPENKIIQEIIKPYDNFVEYLNERDSIILKYYDQTDDGLKLKDNSNTKDFEDEILKLNEKHIESIKERTEQEKNINSFLQKSVDINIHEIKKEDFTTNPTFEEIFSILELFQSKDNKELTSISNDIVTYYNNLILLLKNKQFDIDFKFEMIPNLQILKETINNIILNEDYINYQKNHELERLKLCELFADKNSDGNPIIENNNFKITNLETFNLQLQELFNKNTDIIQKYNELLLQNEKLEINKIDLNIFPKDLNLNELEILSPFIK